MKDCCKHSKKDKKCVRKSDKKTFDLPRKYNRKKCKNPKGFSMKASCAPYKDCFTKKGGRKTKKKKTKKQIYKNNISYFSGGCFWSIQEDFDKLGIKTIVGYMGGLTKDPTYEQVSTGETGHAETVKVIYNNKINFKKLLEYFFKIHNPTTLNKQGNDIGTQYRSIVFYQNTKEKKIYENFINKLPNKNNIVTELLPEKKYKFYKAEEYHQNYNKKNKSCSSELYKTKNQNDFIRICKNNKTTKLAEEKGTGEYNNAEYLNGDREGIYICPCCENELYSSEDIYDSGSGWPAFKKSIRKNSVKILNNNGGEVLCNNCNLHLGHLLKKEHHCINSVCLFLKEDPLPIKTNILNKPIEVCSTNPITGFYRDGYCMTGPDDHGTHTICASMNKKFLKYTKDKGNDLSSVVKPGENWCLCEYRWNEAFNDGKSPHVIKKATNKRTKKKIIKNILNHKKGGKTKKQNKKNKKTKKKPHFLFNPNDPKKSFDVYTDKNPKDTIPIKYTSLEDVKNTINKLERLYKSNKYPHKRIWQVGMIMYVRLKVLKDKKPKEFNLSQRYFKFLGKRTKLKDEESRKKLHFKIH